MSHRKPRRAPIAAAVEPEPTGPVEIFRAGWQAIKVRAIQAVVLLGMMPAAVWGAVAAARTFGLHATEGRALAPWPVRYGLAAFLLAVGVGAGIGMIVYGWCYVTRAVWDPEAGCTRLTLAGLFVPIHRDVPASTAAGAFRHGQKQTGDMTISAPWYSVRIPGRRLPFILDAQGEFLRPRLVDQVLLGGTSALRYLEPEAARRGATR
jgi:hypothetical protein